MRGDPKNRCTYCIRRFRAAHDTRKSQGLSFRLIGSMQCGEIFMLSELSQELANRTVRVTGQVRGLDIHNRMCTLFHKGYSLVVDASLVDIALLSGESMCQVIGELRLGSERFEGASAPPLYLRASVVRVVNGLDVDLFEQSILLRRQFLKDTIR